MGGISGLTDGYISPMQTEFDLDSVEANKQLTFRTAGTISNFTTYITSNASTATSTYVTRINGADGNQSLTIGIAATGEFTDNTNTDSVAVGDEVAFYLQRGNGGNSLPQQTYAYFEADSNGLMVKVGAGGNINFTTASATRYIPFMGDNLNSATESAVIKHPILTTCEAANMQLYVSANTRTSTTFRFRVNGADGNQSITVGSSATGLFEDNTNTDSLAAGDDVNYSITTGTGANTLTLQQISCEITYPSTTMQLFSGNTGGANHTANGNRWSVPVGQPAMNGSVTPARIPLFGSGTVHDAEMYILTNTATSTFTATAQINAGDQSLVMTATAGTTGSFTDTTNSFTFTDGQDFNWRLNKSDTGTTVITRITCLVTFDSIDTFTPQAIWFM